MVPLISCFPLMGLFQVNMLVGVNQLSTSLLIWLGAHSLCQILQVSHGLLPFNHLEVPLYIGAPRRRWLHYFTDKVLFRFFEWKCKTFSMESRLTLITSVVQ